MRLLSWKMFGIMALAATGVSGVFVLNAYVTFVYTGAEGAFGWYFEGASTFWGYMMWAILLPPIVGPVFAREWFWQVSFKTVMFWLVFAVALSALHRALALAAYALTTFVVEGYMLNLFGIHSFNWLMRGTLPSLIQLVIIIAALRAIHINRENTRRLLDLERVRKELATAELNMLKGQMQPHFIFNTLNTIASVMEKNTEAAQDIITRLASLMRSFLESDRKQFVPLSTEIDHTRDYLDIEAARFSDRLKINWTIDEKTEDLPVPNMILQPLVENAIKHGFSKHIEGGSIRITAHMQADGLLLVVADDGMGAESANIFDARDTSGVGLRSVRARLMALYGDRASIAVETAPREGFMVKVKLPNQNGHQTQGTVILGGGA